MQNQNRVLARLKAEELTAEELNDVAGGASGGIAPTSSMPNRPWLADDHVPTDEF